MSGIPAHVAALEDLDWFDRCAPLLRFLKTPRKWDEIAAYRKANGIGITVIGHMLAWLDLNGHASWDGIYWRAGRAPTRKPAQVTVGPPRAGLVPRRPDGGCGRCGGAISAGSCLSCGRTAA